MIYTDPILDKLIEMLNQNGPEELKNKYYVGDPIIVAQGELPMVFISRDTTVISIADTGYDLHSMPIVLNVVYKATKDLSQKAFTQAGTVGLYNLCEGRDADYNLRSDCLAGAIRHNQVLDGANTLYIDINGSDTNIDYVLSPPSRRGMFSVEAIIRITLINKQLRR